MTGYNRANKQKHSRKDPISRWHVRSIMEVIYQLVESTNPKAVLDAGCGEGFVSQYLAMRNGSMSITGVDVQPQAIEFAEKNFGETVNYRLGSLYALPFSDNSFDTVVCSQVLEHLDDVETAMAELKRVARRFVVITVPREPYFKLVNDFARAIRFSDDPGHVNFWTSSDFQKFMGVHFKQPRFVRKHVIYQFSVAPVDSINESFKPDEA